MNHEAEYVNMEYLDRVIGNIQRWAQEKKNYADDKGIVEEAVFRKSVRKALIDL